MANYEEAHICQCLSLLTTVRGDSIVTVYGHRRNTGMQFVEGVLSIARGLVQLGINPGDVVSISALNSDLYVEWILAVTYVGGIAAPLNYRWSLEEALLAMEVAQPVLLVTDSSQEYWHSKFRIDSVGSLLWHVLIDNMPVDANDTATIFPSELLKEPTGRSVKLDFVWAPEKAAVICFTSGTTGRPKGATISHSAIVVQSLAKIAIVRYNENDVYLHTSPLCHIGGISSAMAVLMAGGSHVIIPKFEANKVTEAIREHLVTSFITVPTMMADLISFTRRTSEKFKTVEKILNGGGTLSVELIENATKHFPRAMLLTAYGMTETCSSLTFMMLHDPTKENHFPQLCDFLKSHSSCEEGICVGMPAPHVELRVSLEDSSNMGKILTRGPHVMLRYWGQTSSKHLGPAHEAWLDTGDIGRIDDHGNLWLMGRAKDRIKSGGENIFPEEVESVLSQHPGISKIVVVGVPDSRWTEMVVACVKLEDNWHWDDFCFNQSSKDKVQLVSTEIFKQFCREKNLTGYKIPKKIILWGNTFPLTSTGKLRRDRIRAEVIALTEFLPSRL